MAKKKTGEAAIEAVVGAPTVLSFGCFNNVCVAAQDYPLHLGPEGTQVYLCALNTQLDIVFTGNSPFVSKTKEFSIPYGSCIGPEIVAHTGANTHFKFDLKCWAGCPVTDRTGPEMIVP